MKALARRTHSASRATFAGDGAAGGRHESGKVRVWRDCLEVLREENFE